MAFPSKIEARRAMLSCSVLVWRIFLVSPKNSSGFSPSGGLCSQTDYRELEFWTLAAGSGRIAQDCLHEGYEVFAIDASPACLPALSLSRVPIPFQARRAQDFRFLDRRVSKQWPRSEQGPDEEYLGNRHQRCARAHDWDPGQGAGRKSS